MNKIFCVTTALCLLFGTQSQAQNLSKKELQTRLLAMEQEVSNMKQMLYNSNAEVERLNKQLQESAAQTKRLESLMKSAPQQFGAYNETPPLRTLDGGTKTIDAHQTASIHFETPVYDFGKVKEGEKVTYVYKFKNTSSVPLTITNARGSCGCTVPEWSREPVAPGAMGEIKVVFDSAGKQGLQQKSVTITANTNPTETQLTIKGEVFKP